MELDLSFRNQDLKKKQQPKCKQRGRFEGPKSDDGKVSTSNKGEDDQSKIIREFVEVYLGVLVWCNPKELANELSKAIDRAGEDLGLPMRGMDVADGELILETHGGHGSVRTPHLKDGGDGGAS
ncbi:hypothetical protein BY996DRAFT_6576316 [Phakopsora pachyrhizi]|nr:hypothetical protein BY996DRAFT_6576316 [Phakopsora pachyrhizi]